eukprot:symbB.v1.2.029556.t1/scaffold3245.1/size65031/2
MHFREFISFAKTTPPGDAPQLQEDQDVSCVFGVLQWVDEATEKVFAESKMKQSKILLDLHQDCSSARRPMILAAQPGGNYFMEICARTFTLLTSEATHRVAEACRLADLSSGPQVTIRKAGHLQYMGQKFMKCWQWVLTAGRRKGPLFAESSDEETSSSASFVSIEDGENSETPQVPKVVTQAAASTAADLFVELAEGDFAAGPAWEAAEKALRHAELHVAVENIVISIPLETGGEDKEPAVEIRARHGVPKSVLQAAKLEIEIAGVSMPAMGLAVGRAARVLWMLSRSAANRPLWGETPCCTASFRWSFCQVSICEAGGVRMVPPQESDETLGELSAKQLLVEVKKHAAPRAVISFSVWEAALEQQSAASAFQPTTLQTSFSEGFSSGAKGALCAPRMLLLQMPLLRRCWAWMFPPQPWFTPPIVLWERPSSQTKVRATLQDAHVLLEDKFEEKAGPLISVVTNMTYRSHFFGDSWRPTNEATFWLSNLSGAKDFVKEQAGVSTDAVKIKSANLEEAPSASLLFFGSCPRRKRLETLACPIEIKRSASV